MPRKNANTASKPTIRSRPVKPKRKPTDKPGKLPKTPVEEDAAVSLSRLRANPRRGGRGR